MMTTPSDTPRTDERAFQASWMERAVVDANFARALESELASANRLYAEAIEWWESACARAEKAEAAIERSALILAAELGYDEDDCSWGPTSLRLLASEAVQLVVNLEGVIDDRESAELRHARATIADLTRKLNGLLAVIHGDGGHYREEVGDEQAYTDAIVDIAQERIKIDDLERKLREAEREVSVLRQYGNKDCTAMADAALKGDNNA